MSDTPNSPFSPKRRRTTLIVAGLGGLTILYAAIPLGWRHFERLRRLDGHEMITRTAQGIPGDPINVGFVASPDELACAFEASGWRPANPVTWKSSLKIVGSVLLKHPYPDAPVSPLYFDKRIEDLAFELPIGQSAAQRHHVRLWKVEDRGEDGQPVWLGSASLDRSVGISHYTLRVTHHIDGDLDQERNFLIDLVASGGRAKSVFEITGSGPTVAGHNGGGDRYFTDGEIKVAELTPACAAPPALAALPAPKTSRPPLLVRLKNKLFKALRPWLRTLPVS